MSLAWSTSSSGSLHSISHSSDSKDWESNVLFSPYRKDDGKCDGEFTLTEAQLLEELKRPGNDYNCMSKIVSMWSMKESLNENEITKLVAHHQYVIVQTKDEFCWSFEKDSKQIVIQRGKSFLSVNGYKTGRARFCSEVIDRKEINGENATIFLLFLYLKNEKQLQKVYNPGCANCIHFAKEIFNCVKKANSGQGLSASKILPEALKWYNSLKFGVTVWQHPQKHAFELHQDTKINQILADLAVKENFKPEEADLFLGYVRLDKRQTLKQSGVQNNSVLYLFVGTPGCGENASRIPVHILDKSGAPHTLDVRISEPVQNIMMLVEDISKVRFAGPYHNVNLMFGREVLDASKTLKDYGIDIPNMPLCIYPLKQG